jgi:MOSC domain-containing protein YiiM
VEFLDALRKFPRAGRVEWIGLTPAPREALVEFASVVATPGRGLEGDRHAKSGRPSRREVTLILREHLEVVGALIGRPVFPGEVRRNVVVSGIALTALNGCRFRLGEVLLEGTGPCDPCSRMEEALGEGGQTAMRGHGGLCAVVVEGGTFHVGDAVTFVVASS